MIESNVVATENICMSSWARARNTNEMKIETKQKKNIEEKWIQVFSRCSHLFANDYAKFKRYAYMWMKCA